MLEVTGKTAQRVFEASGFAICSFPAEDIQLAFVSLSFAYSSLVFFFRIIAFCLVGFSLFSWLLIKSLKSCSHSVY
jgi:hypothetical protein